MQRNKSLFALPMLIIVVIVAAGCGSLSPLPTTLPPLDTTVPMAVDDSTDSPTDVPSPTLIPPTPMPTLAVHTATATPIPATIPWIKPVYDANGVRICDFIPGKSVPVETSPDQASAPTLTPTPPPTFPPTLQTDPAVTARQLGLYHELWNIVNRYYVDPEFNGNSWDEIGDRYETLINEGLSDAGFYKAMHMMIEELGDDHSYFMDPQEVQEIEDLYTGLFDFVGLGAIAMKTDDGEHSMLTAIFPDSPAEEARLRPHDVILAVDGQSPYDENDTPRTLGVEGTVMALTVQRPGQQPRELIITRRRVTSNLQLDYCLISGTRVGYIMLPWFLSDSIDDQTIAALDKMTDDGPLDGLILDNRVNTGGYDDVMVPILSLFMNGSQGYYVSRESHRELVVYPIDVGESQSVPLVVLVGRNTTSNGEISSGLLGLSGRAMLIGETTPGNVEHMHSYDISDGSQVWLATETFEPPGLSAGIWEETGVMPGIFALSAWEQFTEAADPGIAAAIQFLLNP